MSAGLFGMDLERIFNWRPTTRYTWTPEAVAQMIRLLQGNGLDIVAELVRGLIARVNVAERRVSVLEERAAPDRPRDGRDTRTMLLHKDGTIRWTVLRGDQTYYQEIVDKFRPVSPTVSFDSVPEVYRSRTFLYATTVKSREAVEFNIFEEAR